MVDDHPSMPQLGAHASPPIGFELVADRRDRLDDRGVVVGHNRLFVKGGAGDPHQPASFCDAEAGGPTMTDIVAFLGRGALFTAPLRN